MKPNPEKPPSQTITQMTPRLAQGAKDYPLDDIVKIIDEALASVSKKSYARF